MDRLHSLQSLIGEFGADTYPLFLRMGAVRALELHPVAARTLLAEVEKFQPLLQGQSIPGISFQDAQGRYLGAIYGETPVAHTDESSIAVTPEGIRITLKQLPPPVGFRSDPSLESGWFACYFTSLQFTPEGAVGRRTAAMGGSGAPVSLPGLAALPPATRWHESKVSGKVSLGSVTFAETPAEEVFRDILHTFTAASTEALRLKRPLRILRER